MNRRVLRISITLLMVLCILVSCTDGSDKDEQLSVGGKKKQQSLEVFDVLDNLEFDLNRISESYDKITSVESKTYSVEELRKACGYPGFGIQQELGMFVNYKDASEITFGDTSFKMYEKAKISMGNSVFVETYAFLIDDYSNTKLLYGPSPVIALELLSYLPVIKVNGISYKVEDFPPVTTPIQTKNAFWGTISGKTETFDSIPILANIYHIDSYLIDKIYLAFQFEPNVKFFFTKATFLRNNDVVDTVYAFSKPTLFGPNEKQTLVFNPLKETSILDFDHIDYMVCMYGEDGTFYRSNEIHIGLENYHQ